MKLAIITDAVSEHAPHHRVEAAGLETQGIDARVYSFGGQQREPGPAELYPPRTDTGDLRHLPRAASRMMHLAAQGQRPPLSVLRHLPRAVALADELGRWGVDHIHATSPGLAAQIAALCAPLNGCGCSLTVDRLRPQSKVQGAATALRVETLDSETPRSDLRVASIPPSIDLSAFQPVPYRRSKSFRIRALSTGLTHHTLDRVLRALADVNRPDWTLTVISAGAGRALLYHQAEALGLRQRITCVMPPQGDAMHEFYDTADLCLCLTDKTGTMPSAQAAHMQRAAAHQRPILAVTCPQSLSLLPSERFGWRVDPGSQHALTKSLIDVFDNPRHAEQRAFHARARLEDHFDTTRTLPNLAAFFARAAAPAAATARATFASGAQVEGAV